MQQDLIPGLPDDVALECLLRVAYKGHAAMRSVCRRWEALVDSQRFHEDRRRMGLLRNCICLVQQVIVEEASSSSGVQGNQGSSSQNHIFGRETSQAWILEEGSSSSNLQTSKDWELMDFPDKSRILGASDQILDSSSSGIHWNVGDLEVDSWQSNHRNRQLGLPPNRENNDRNRVLELGSSQNHIFSRDDEILEQQKNSPRTERLGPPGLGLSIFDPVENSWEWLPPIPPELHDQQQQQQQQEEHSLPLFCQCVFVNGGLIVLGGWNPSTYEALRAVFIFSFSSRRWRRGADMLAARSFFACAAMLELGLVVVAGGHDDDKNALSSAEAYDIRADSWRPLPDLSQERDECRGVVVGKEFFAISGYSTDSQGRFVASADVFDPALGRWRREEELWVEGVCPSGFVASPMGSSLFAFQRQELIVRESISLPGAPWKPVSSLPGNARMCALASAPGSGLFVAADESTHCRSFLLDLGKDWRPVENPPGFRGLAQDACAIEV